MGAQPTFKITPTNNVATEKKNGEVYKNDKVALDLYPTGIDMWERMQTRKEECAKVKITVFQ